MFPVSVIKVKSKSSTAIFFEKQSSEVALCRYKIVVTCDLLVPYMTILIWIATYDYRYDEPWHLESVISKLVVKIKLEMKPLHNRHGCDHLSCAKTIAVNRVNDRYVLTTFPPYWILMMSFWGELPCGKVFLMIDLYAASWSDSWWVEMDQNVSSKIENLCIVTEVGGVYRCVLCFINIAKWYHLWFAVY